MLNNIHDCVLDGWSDVTIWFLVIGVDWVIADKDICSQIRGEDYEGVAEINLVTLTVRQKTFI